MYFYVCYHNFVNSGINDNICITFSCSLNDVITVISQLDLKVSFREQFTLFYIFVVFVVFSLIYYLLTTFQIKVQKKKVWKCVAVGGAVRLSANRDTSSGKRKSGASMQNDASCANEVAEASLTPCKRNSNCHNLTKQQQDTRFNHDAIII